MRTAAREFARHGVDGIGIAGLMKAAGLTQGAFSGHFASKEELVREAMNEAFQLSRFTLPEWREKSLDEIVRFYLSKQHRDLSIIGCPAGTLSAEISRQPRRTRNLFISHLSRTCETIESKLPRNKSPKDRKQAATAIFATLVGTLQLARVTKDTKMSDEIMETGIRTAAALAEMKS